MSSMIIYTSKGVARTEITPSEQSLHHKELMQSDYISLQFNAPLIDFAVGDYIIVNGAKYVLLDVDKPTSNKSQYYAYTLRFDADWQLLGKRVFFYNRQSGSESKWSITAKAATFVQLIVDNANSVGIGTFTAEVDSDLTNLQFIEFDGTSILDALTMIAEAYECDWWIESNVIHLGTCKIGTAVSLRVGEALTSINRTEASNDVVTRLYAFGSTRNLPSNYRKDTSSAIIDGVVQQRLRLPKGTDYIDVRPNLADNEIIEGVRIFENIYPRTNGAISSVTTKQYTTTTDNADGSTTTETWNAYRFVDNGIKFSRDYQISGQDLQVQFQSGSLAGMTFVVEFNPDGEDEASSKAQVWEIIRNDNYGINLPNDTIKPEVGDTYVLTGWDSTKISSLGLVDAAEQELLTEATKWLQKNGNGVYNYECETNSIWCSGYRRVNGEFVFAASNIIDLELGQSVALYDELLIGSSGFNSRVRAYEKNLINPYVCRYTIGETNNYSKTDSLQQQVDAINRSTDPTLPTFVQGGSIRLIKRYDSTPESDSLAYSSLRTKHEYLNKTTEDTAEKHITFADGLTASKVVSDFLQSIGFSPNFGGSGFSLQIVDGKSYLTVDNAYIRNKTTFDELEIREVTHTGGVEIKSPASCKIANTADYYPHIALVDANGQEIADKDGNAVMVLDTESTGVKCYFRASDGEKTIYNDWRIGDQALCQSFNVENGSRYYWRRVVDVSAAPENGYHWVALSLTDGEGDTPMSGDTIVCFGSSMVDRQAAIIMAANGTNAPCFVQLKGISGYVVDESNVVTLLSPTKNIIKGHQIVMMSEGGEKDVAAEFKVQSDKISSVVSKQSGIVDDYAFADFTIKNGRSPDWAGDAIGSPVGFEKADVCQMLIITNAKVGDVVRFKPNATSQRAIVTIIGTDGNAQGAEQDAYDLNSSEYGNYAWYGLSLTERYTYNIEVGGSIEYVVSVDCPELCVWLSDDWSEKSNLELSHIKAKMSAQSRIEQSADNIRLQVGNAGINLDNQNITLTASKTTINGDLAVSVVKCYYDEAKTQLRSAYNGNGDGTIVYYYPNGQVMRQDAFVTDTSGNVLGMRTTYYKADGSVAWVLSEGGIQTTLYDYWEAINGGKALAYTDSTTTMMDICKQYLGEAMRYFSSSQFSRFVSQSGNYKAYNGKVAKGLKSSEIPTSVALYSGVLVYSIELVQDGVLPTYQVAYEQVTTVLNQLSAIVTKKFNSLGEVS